MCRPGGQLGQQWSHMLVAPGQSLCCDPALVSCGLAALQLLVCGPCWSAAMAEVNEDVSGQTGVAREPCPGGTLQGQAAGSSPLPSPLPVAELAPILSLVLRGAEPHWDGCRRLGAGIAEPGAARLVPAWPLLPPEVLPHRGAPRPAGQFNPAAGG